MKKDDLIVGRVKMNPVGNKLVPCIKLIMFDGLSDNELVLLKVIDSKFDFELNDAIKKKK